VSAGVTHVQTVRGKIERMFARQHALRIAAICAAVLAGTTALAQPPRRAPAPKAPAPPSFFTTPLSLDQMRGKQAVLTTSAGDLVVQLLPEAAPNHVGYFMKLAQEGAYDGTTFHRVIKYGIIQGGDPLSKDPEKRALHGTGGLGLLKAEVSAEKHTAGTMSAVIQPGKPDSAGAQFFICVTDQPALDGQYTVFGRLVEGIEVAQKLSEAPVDADGKAVDRLVIERVVVRDTPPPEVPPFSAESLEELAGYRAVLETSLGDVTLELFPDRAPIHVRNFLRLATIGVYDGMAFHRVVPGFVVQTGSLTTRSAPLTRRQQGYVVNLPPEFSDTKHVKGILSMARGDDPASATTSFFLCVGTTPVLDGKYTVFGRVVSGLDVLEAIERIPVDGETPRTRIDLKRVRIEKR
jgi:peptidyl-prolyl cis-trans isomerase B (cyclophilin B)